MKAIRASWLVGDAGVREMTRWLGDTAVVRGIASEHGKLWAARVCEPGARPALLCSNTQ